MHHTPPRPGYYTVWYPAKIKTHLKEPKAYLLENKDGKVFQAYRNTHTPLQIILLTGSSHPTIIQQNPQAYITPGNTGVQWGDSCNPFKCMGRTATSGCMSTNAETQNARQDLRRSCRPKRNKMCQMLKFLR